MKKIITSYKITRELNLVTISQRVIEKMENNPLFVNPPAALVELKKVLPEFQDALVKARSRDKEMVSIKNDKRAAMEALLSNLADYVNITCGGDKTSILSSGFDVLEQRGSLPAPSIEMMEVKLGSAGEATIRVTKRTGAKAYMHQYTTEVPGPETTWISEGSSQRSHTFKGLVSDRRYWFRVVAIGVGGQTAYSPVVSRAIQ